MENQDGEKLDEDLNRVAIRDENVAACASGGKSMMAMIRASCWVADEIALNLTRSAHLNEIVVHALVHELEHGRVGGEFGANQLGDHLAAKVLVHEAWDEAAANGFQIFVWSIRDWFFEIGMRRLFGQCHAWNSGGGETSMPPGQFFR